MVKKYVISAFIAFLYFGGFSVQAHPKSAQFLEGKDDLIECLNVTFEDPNFSVSFSSGNGEIVSWTIPDESNNITEEELYFILIDCAEKIFGKGTDRFEVNKEKFMSMIEELRKIS